MRRHIVIGAAAVLLVITLAAMLASVLQLRVKLEAGCLSVSAYGPVQPDGVRYGTTAEAGWLWPPKGFTDYDRGGWGVVLPLWMPALAGAGALIAAFLVGRRSRGWAREGRCLSCGYDRSGVAGPCPECGRDESATA